MLSLPETGDEEGEDGEDLETTDQHQKGKVIFCEDGGRFVGAARAIGSQSEAIAADGGDGDTD